MTKFMPRRRHRAGQGGFTLPEALVTLAIITIISFLVIGSVGPWLGLKQSIDNDRRMQDLRQGLTNLYDSRAMAAEREAPNTFFGFKTSSIDAQGNCAVQAAPFVQLNTLINDAGANASRDGFGNPWCIFVSGQLNSVRDGTTLYYRNVAVVSAGRDAKLDATSRMDGAGTLTLGGDDVGFVVSGYDIQNEKLKETMRRLSRVANTYEAYFSTRFLAGADRDITRDYFSTAWDPTGSVNSTGGSWGQALTQLGGIGVSPNDAVSAWETDNAIEVGNYSETVNSQQVRSPAVSGAGALPYTALLRTLVPAPAGQSNYVARVVVGNY